MSPARIPAPGFAEAVADAQRTFRAALDALARPTRPVALRVLSEAPGALTPTAGALVLALCDDATPIWLDPSLAGDEDVTGWIAFHTASPLVDDPARAAFALAVDAGALPPLAGFQLGTDEAPHTSTTCIVGVGAAAPTTRVLADGPGFPEPADWDAPLSAGFVDEWQGNAASFPRGVDLLLAGRDAIVGLPRTTALRPAPAVSGSAVA